MLRSGLNLPRVSALAAGWPHLTGSPRNPFASRSGLDFYDFGHSPSKDFRESADIPHEVIAREEASGSRHP